VPAADPALVETTNSATVKAWTALNMMAKKGAALTTGGG
jgi:hypothetical protein